MGSKNKFRRNNRCCTNGIYSVARKENRKENRKECAWSRISVVPTALDVLASGSVIPGVKTSGLQYISCLRHWFVQEASSGGTNEIRVTLFPGVKTSGLQYISCLRHWLVQKASSGGTNDIVAMEFIPLQKKTILLQCDLNKFTNKTLNDYEKHVGRKRAGRTMPEWKRDFQEDMDDATNGV